MISVIIPANNEAGYIGACLEALAGSAPLPGEAPAEVIVVANGCTDDTVARAQALVPEFAGRGWSLKVIDLEEGSKIAALNAGDAAATHKNRAYIDADIRVSPDLLAELAEVLQRDAPVYASGQIRVPPARSALSARYARFWQRLPFITRGVPGCGVFAVNAPARARWDRFPDIISDDSFVRAHFTPEEMQAVPAPYDWPVTEGFASLVRVRRRQNEGLEELQRVFPALGLPPSTPGGGETLRLFFRDPVGFVVYAAVAASVRLPLFRNRGGWDRGR